MQYMTYFSKVRNIFGKAGTHPAVSNSSMLQDMRSMFMSKLFVGGLPFDIDELSLKEAFSKYGQVVEAKVILERETGKPRGFGFVTFTSGDEASGAMKALDGHEVNGRRLRVTYAANR